ncbi:MAG: imidazolonepropionase [Bdellovibrionia bacterium]
MILFRNTSEVLTLAPAMKKAGRHIQEEDLGIHTKAAFIADKGKILWLGSINKIPRSLASKVKKEVDLQKSTVLPGFIECHTHSLFAGDRSAEFEMRNNGISYQEIAARGGGILSTVRATRSSSPAKLLSSTQKRVDLFIQQGVTTLEVKSGYALNLKDEFKMLSVAQKLKGPHVVPTFLGAHALAPEFKNTSDYIAYLISEVLPALQKRKLAERIDIFIEKGFFSPEDGARLFRAAKNFGFKNFVVHADQLTLSGGTALGLEYQALSVDHVLKIDSNLIQKLAQSETTAVLLPAADLYMKVPYPPARQLIDSGARVTLATDFNPGTSPTQSLDLVGLLARLEMKMTLPEVIGAYTVGASFALGLQNTIGSLEPQKSADFLCIDEDWRQLFYSVGKPLVQQVFREGKSLYTANK